MNFGTFSTNFTVKLNFSLRNNFFRNSSREGCIGNWGLTATNIYIKQINNIKDTTVASTENYIQYLYYKHIN